MKLYFEKHGVGQPLLLLHGNSETHKIFDKAVKVLEPYFTVYTPDTRGHGKSPKVKEFHYEEMAEDMAELIAQEHMKKPIVYGFSDGGILALLLAIRHKDLLSRAFASGVNTDPKGVQRDFLTVCKAIYFVTRSPLFKLMMTEPHITKEELKSITIPVTIIAGEKDLVMPSHMREIAAAIPQSKYIEIPGASHESYVVHKEDIAWLLLRELGIKE